MNNDKDILELTANLNHISILINSNSLSKEKQMEYIILYKKVNKTMKDVLIKCSNQLKDYYKSTLDISEINQLIKEEEQINLSFTWNKVNSFSCKFIRLDNREEGYIVSENILDGIKKLKDIVNNCKGIKITDFRCRENRAYYVDIINTLNILSQLKYNSILLK